MARTLRVEYPGAYYHVINRGNNQEKIFKNKAREVAIYIARDMTGITCKDLGEYFGGVSGALITMKKLRGRVFILDRLRLNVKNEDATPWILRCPPHNFENIKRIGCQIFISH